MQTVTIQLPKLHQAQQKILRERKRRNVIACGRRFGKNVLLQDLAVECALKLRAPCGWGAPVYKQMLEDYNSLANTLAPVITRKSAAEMRLDLLGGGVIQFWSLERPDSIRGNKYRRFIVNEAGFVPDLLDIRNYIIMPTLIDMQGDEYYSGTPKGMNGFFALYNQTGEDWAHWQMSSYENPHIPRTELDALKNVMTERAFQQEILAQFLEDGGGVFRHVNAAAVLEPEQPQPGKQYVIGVDWGRSEDATVFCVLDSESKRQVWLDRMTDTDYASQRLRLKALSERYNNAPVIAEANSIGQPNIEALQQMGVGVTGFTTTNVTKAQIIQELELAFERGEIVLLKDDVQTNELLAFQSEKLPSGLVRYSAPDGIHDDTVMALALAWHGRSRPLVIFGV
jgi:phage terminase large subunit-like protein